jgi:2-C-methyl-D-erythritol 4-phosphate cytidylyltransferase
MEVDAVVVAAGSSQRFGKDKLLADLAGKPVLGWTLSALASIPSIRAMVLVVQEQRLAEFEALSERWAAGVPRCVVAGGERRRDSVAAGIEATASEFVLIHDGARPLVTRELVERCIDSAPASGCAVPVVPIADTVKEVKDGRVVAHPSRERLRAAQTPQLVHRNTWLRAATMDARDETDDAAMIGRTGQPVVAVEGDPNNIKITRPEDLLLAEHILANRKA